MTGYSLAVYNDSPDYINRFLAYCRNNQTLFKVIGFTDPKTLTEYLENSSIDILLLSRGDTLDNNIDKNRDLNMLLSQGSVSEIVYLGEQPDHSSSPKTLNIYQPMKSLLGELEQIAGAIRKSDPFAGTDADVLGVFALDGAPDINTFIMTLAGSNALAASRILYIDLDRFSGMQEQYEIPVSGSLSDLIYTYLTDPDRIADILENVTSAAGNIHYVAAPVSPCDPDEISPAEWKVFIGRLSQAGRYDTVIINISVFCRDLISLFSICRKIFLFPLNSPEAIQSTHWSESFSEKKYLSCRTNAFLNYLSENSGDYLFARFSNGYSTFKELLPSPESPEAGKRAFRKNGKH